jgi:hypothetical protein
MKIKVTQTQYDAILNYANYLQKTKCRQAKGWLVKTHGIRTYSYCAIGLGFRHLGYSPKRINKVINTTTPTSVKFIAKLLKIENPVNVLVLKVRAKLDLISLNDYSGLSFKQIGERIIWLLKDSFKIV